MNPKFYQELDDIRGKEFKRQKQIEFEQFQVEYEEHINELYNMICKYYGTINYNEFVNTLYNTIAPHCTRYKY